MQVIIFALLSFLGWGSGDVFATAASRKLGSYSSAFWGYFFGLVPSSIFIPFFLANITHFTPGILLLNIALAILLVVCWVAFNEALRIGNPSLVGTIGGASASLIVIFSVIFLGEKVTALQVGAILITFVGFLLTSLNFSDLRKIHIHLTEKSILLAIVCMVGWGIYFTFIKLPIREVGWFWPNYIACAIGTAYFAVFGLKRIVMPKKSNQKGLLMALGSALLTTTATFSFNFAISKGSSTIVAPIAGSYPVLFVLLSSIFFKEPISTQQKFGIFVTVVGIVILSFSSA